MWGGTRHARQGCCHVLHTHLRLYAACKRETRRDSLETLSTRRREGTLRHLAADVTAAPAEPSTWGAASTALRAASGRSSVETRKSPSVMPLVWRRSTGSTSARKCESGKSSVFIFSPSLRRKRATVTRRKSSDSADERQGP
eukprot:1143822-Rhodomonas_salina.4